MKNTLVRFERAKQALIEASSYDEVKDIRDTAIAIKAYAIQINDTVMEEHAARIKLRAERRAGEMLAGMDKAKGGQPYQDNPTGNIVAPVEAPTLSEIGITKRQSSDWQKMATIDESTFEDHLKSHNLTTTSLIVRKSSCQKIRKDNEKKKAETPKPEFTGKYDVLVIDPPWPMKKIERDVAPNQHDFDYPTMDELEMTKLDLPFADDCHVFMWTTHKFLPMALRLFDSWRVKYVLTMVWHKPGGFQPFGLPQYNCEFALYGRVGVPKFVDTKAFPVCFNAKRGSHSEKPEEFYDVIRRVTDGNRIDIFNRRTIKGFDVWGNESGN